MPQRRSYYIVNAITLYRLVVVPLLIYLVFARQTEIFKWLLAFSFFTDLIDGTLARTYKVTSILGSKLDSIADDLTILSAIIGVFILKPEFIRQEIVLIIILFVLYISETLFAFLRYGRISSFHTYLAKIAAVFQGVFLILIFFLPEIPYVLFYVAAALTLLDLIEEIILIFLLDRWETNVKGLYWVMKRQRI